MAIRYMWSAATKERRKRGENGQGRAVGMLRWTGFKRTVVVCELSLAWLVMYMYARTRDGLGQVHAVVHPARALQRLAMRVFV